MTFNLYIYYCALCGGWAGFVAWGVLALAGVAAVEGKSTGQVIAVGAVLGMLVAAAIGLIDAVLNASGSGQRLVRMLVCAGVGLAGGLLGSLLGSALYSASELLILLVVGWMLAGVLIGASLGVFDMATARGDIWQPLKKTRNGIYGGLLGGFLGGFPFGLMQGGQLLPVSSSLAIGLVILGLCIGLLVALAQVFLKDAWIVIEAGRRAGKQMILSKDEVTIGRAESCDIGLFGDPAVEKLHARIRTRNNRYLLEDAQTPGGTFLNDQRVEKPTPLRSGDAIRVGGCVLRFGEKAKRA
jgi:hypothetical protein